MVPSRTEWGKPVEPRGCCRKDDTGLLSLGHKTLRLCPALSQITRTGEASGHVWGHSSSPRQQPHDNELRTPAKHQHQPPSHESKTLGRPSCPAESSDDRSPAESLAVASGETVSRTVRPSCSQVPSPQKLWDDTCLPCFKPRSFEVTCYAATEN